MNKTKTKHSAFIWIHRIAKHLLNAQKKSVSVKTSRPYSIDMRKIDI